MITKEELNAVKLSATKKDFYQIWNELLQTAGKISERWDPASTNESDPGIVLLKVLTAVADKLNYNIDVNALEDFMPSAAQEESMRKLTEMLGYNMRYFQSATTNIIVAYNKPETAPINRQIFIDKFTNIKDIDDTVNYVTLEQVSFNADDTSKSINCIEGELIECETDNDNIISIMQLNDNNKYYLPETQIAENGIFVYNVNDNTESEKWQKVENLNTQPLGTPCYKFGFDSRENLPYIQFPEDITDLIEDGLKIKYIRTNGINGNISPKTLSKFEKPASWQVNASSADEETDTSEEYYNPENYTIYNPSAAKNGANKESLTDAYNNFKKTIGTFDTLITCRDYMNKIYQLLSSDTNTIPLVSNIIVSDIRDDINKANILCTFGPYGIEYKNVARAVDADYEAISAGEWDNKIDTGFTSAEVGKKYRVVDGSAVYYYEIESYTENDTTGYRPARVLNNTALQPFDLVFYPFKTIYGLNTKAEYVKSFKYDDSNILEIKEDIEKSKTLSHNIVLPDNSDIACIKNYYNINASIITTYKVNTIEQAEILNKVYSALFEKFNMRKVDFGKELVEEEIQKVIKNADPRIKDINWNDPELVTKICLVNGEEYGLDETAGQRLYNKLVLNNVLAGRISLFNYDENFKPEFNETAYPGIDSIIPENTFDNTKGIKEIETQFKVNTDIAQGDTVNLKANQVIQFRFPNLKTTVTYPAYVNYYFKKKPNEQDIPAIPAVMLKLYSYLNSASKWANLANSIVNITTEANITSLTTFKNVYNLKHALLKKDSSTNDFVYVTNDDASYEAGVTYYYIDLKEDNYIGLKNWLEGDLNVTPALLYSKGLNINKEPGYLVDENKIVYGEINAWRSEADPLAKFYVPDITQEASGLGQNAEVTTIAEGTEYKLQPNEYLLINYTPSTSDGTSSSMPVNEYYGPGTIIKPNFELVDSETWRKSHSYSKTDGYDFTKWTTNPLGLFTFGSNEQVEIREFVNVKLDSCYNIYWKCNNEAINGNDRINFPWDHDPINKITGEPITGAFNPQTDIYTSYTLQDGELFIFTNKDKNDLAVYGSGTKITRTHHTPEIYKSRFDNEVSADEVSSNGLYADIPWRYYDLRNESSDIKSEITLTEYQYITLADGSTLNEVELKNNVEYIDNTWRECEGASYTIIGGNGEQSLPVTLIDDKNWEVRSKLYLDVGPVKSQQLYKTTYTEDSIIIRFPNDYISPITVAPIDSETPVSFKSNRVIQSSDTITSIGYTDIFDTTSDATYYDCQLKIFEANTVKNNDNGPVVLNNFDNEKFTKITFNDAIKDVHKPFITLGLSIPDNHFGLLMIQNNKIGSSTRNACIRVINSDDEPVIFNNNNSWWDGFEPLEESIWATPGSYFGKISQDKFNELQSSLYIRTSETKTKAQIDEITDRSLKSYIIEGDSYTLYTYAPAESYNADTLYCQLLDEGEPAGGGTHALYKLKEGINIIQLNSACSLQIFADSECKDTIILSNLDLVYSDELKAINPKLQYKALEEATPYDQLLKDIKTLDPDNKFYYNAMLNNETALDLNQNKADDTLEDPYNWYNYNNVNNKFVISEINADYLTTGIVITRNSKL